MGVMGLLKRRLAGCHCFCRGWTLRSGGSDRQSDTSTPRETDFCFLVPSGLSEQTASARPLLRSQGDLENKQPCSCPLNNGPSYGAPAPNFT
jgi:hypothetical protein